MAYMGTDLGQYGRRPHVGAHYHLHSPDCSNCTNPFVYMDLMMSSYKDKVIEQRNAQIVRLETENVKLRAALRDAWPLRA